MTHSRPVSGHGELLSIQYLRGVAALTVLVSHTLQWPLAQMTQGLLRSGRLGVEVFFVISGFIITRVAGDGAFDRVKFLSRRAWRIVPLYWGATLAVTVLALTLPSLFRTTHPTMLGVADSLLFIPSESAKAPLLGVGWTLDYEIFFYLVFACFADLVSETRTLVVCGLMAGLMLIGQVAPHETAFEYFYTSPSLLGFALGCVLAQAHRHGAIARLARLPAAWMIGAALALTALFFVIPAADEARRAPFTYHLAMSAAAIAIVGGALALESARNLRPIKALHYLGDASYSIYLFHLFAVGAGWAIAHRLWPDSLLEYVLVAVATGSGALAVGLMAHHLIERPILKLQKLRARKATGNIALAPA
ncbi:MAG TPA: acyltransferase [Rhizomicrobium sp.]|jgi:exopolysaccharide production protein ExoZ|nr:acyltransferase [Rhizomicrobium sp.]